jgi:hypothetical protein
MKQLLKMKQLIKSIGLTLLSFFLVHTVASAQDEKPEIMVNLHYFSVNNGYQYLRSDVKLKANNSLRPLKDVVLQVYLDSLSAENLIGKTRTDEKGQAISPIPYSLRDKWMASAHHKFVVVTEATQKSDETTTELEITKARIVLDTLNEDGTRSLKASVESFDNGNWIPAKDVEVKIGAKRLGGFLKISDDESFTTDSTGTVTGEFKLANLPSDDAKKNITLVARTEDNDQYGNLSIEKTVPWGVVVQHTSNFNKRSLWSTRHRAPLWLLFMAYSIIATVWSVIIYLIFQIVKISKLGKEYDAADAKSQKKIKETEYAID